MTKKFKQGNLPFVSPQVITGCEYERTFGLFKTKRKRNESATRPAPIQCLNKETRLNGRLRLGTSVMPKYANLAKIYKLDCKNTENKQLQYLERMFWLTLKTTGFSNFMKAAVCGTLNAD